MVPHQGAQVTDIERFYFAGLMLVFLMDAIGHRILLRRLSRLNRHARERITHLERIQGIECVEFDERGMSGCQWRDTNKGETFIEMGGP